MYDAALPEIIRLRVELVALPSESAAHGYDLVDDACLGAGPPDDEARTNDVPGDFQATHQGYHPEGRVPHRPMIFRAASDPLRSAV